MEDLQDEQMDRDDRIELPLAKAMGRLAANVENHIGGNKPTEPALEAKAARSESVGHPWPPVKGCREETPLWQEAFVRASLRKALCGSARYGTGAAKA